MTTLHDFLAGCLAVICLQMHGKNVFFDSSAMSAMTIWSWGLSS